MTLPSQFSLEEENFYKDIQDLVKKGSQNEKELSMFLERYMDLLARADLDDETFIINFTKAALILEASAKVYGSKVDRLWITLERVLESLKVKSNQTGKKNDGAIDDEEGEGAGDDAEHHKKLPRRRKKVGEALSSPDDFLDIDNITGILGKNMNENNNNNEKKIKFHEKIPNLFIRNKTERKRIDVCLIKASDDRDDSRLRDWIISLDNMLVKEMYTSQPSEMNSSRIPSFVSERGAELDDEVSNFGGPEPFEAVEPVETSAAMEPIYEPVISDEANNNVEPPVVEKFHSTEHRDMVVEAMNISEEVDLPKFPNIREVDRGDNCLVDVNDVFWNSTRFEDVIPSKRLRSGKSVRLPCQLCADRKRHRKKGRRCSVDFKNESLDSYFSPHVQPSLSDPQFGVLPDEELYDVYKTEMKIIDELAKVDVLKNINDVFHPDENARDFIGWDPFDNYLMTKKPEFEEDEISEDNLLADQFDDDVQTADDPNHNKDFELPYPVTENSIQIPGSIRIPARIPDEMVSALSAETSQLEYQELLTQLKDQSEAKSSFEKNKELGMKISQWHASLVDKIQLSQKRGALNMNVLAGKIMESFRQEKTDENPVVTFQDLVKGQNRKDIPRYFLACLQLTNEGNVDIHKANQSPLATDCMVLTRLRATRVRHELDEYSPSNNSPQRSPARSRLQSSTSSKRRRSSVASSPSDSEDEVRATKKSKVNKKTEKEKCRKRRKSPSDNPIAKNRKKRKD